MVVNVLLAIGRMSTRDFKEYEMGRKYYQRIKEVCNDIVADFFREVYDDNFEANFSENTFIENYTKSQDVLEDVTKNVSMMNKKRFDLVIFLDDHPLNPDAVISVEMNLCNMIRIPCTLIDFNQIVEEVKANNPLIAKPNREVV